MGIGISAALTWVVGACGSTTSPAAPPVTIGAMAPVVDSKSVDGRAVTSRDRPALISFLALGPGADGRSRSQLTVLKSMAQQYAAQGLVVAVGDTSGLSTDQLVNLTYDWDLQNTGIALLTAAATSKLSAAYRPAVPDTIVVTPNGVVLDRWQGGVAAAQELAPPIQSLVNHH